MKVKDLSELQTHRHADTKLIATIPKFQPWVKSKHKITKFIGLYQRAVFFPVAMSS